MSAKRRLSAGLGALWLGLAVALVSAGVMAQQPAPTATPPPAESVVIVPEALLRGGPGVEYLSVGSILEDTVVTPVNISANADWVLIRFRGGFGWVRRDLIAWGLDVTALPVLAEPALTPTVPPGQESATPELVTLTPSGNYVINARTSALVRHGPGQSFPRVGVLEPGATVQPFAVDEAGDWVLIRYRIDPPASDQALGTREPIFDGFAWVARNLIFWVDDLDALPVMADDALTPSATATITATSTLTPTATTTPTATATQVIGRANLALTATREPTMTATTTPTSTHTPTATVTSSATPTATATPSPSATLTTTSEPSATITPSPSATLTTTSEPSATITPSPSATLTTTSEPSATITITPTSFETAQAVIQGQLTEAAIQTLDSATETPTLTVTPTPTATAERTAVAIAPAEAETSPDVPDAIPPETADDSATLPFELIIGGTVTALLLVYVVLYLRGQAALDRYTAGFVLSQCPVCERGTLSVETRTERIVGIPQARHIVRCDQCRSILREVGPNQWRYAVDPLENESIYRRYNGETLTERQLRDLSIGKD